jgi:hypothetical protein
MAAFSSNNDSKGGGWHRRAWSWAKEKLNSEDMDTRVSSRPNNGDTGDTRVSRRVVTAGGVLRNMRFEVSLDHEHCGYQRSLRCGGGNAVNMD